MAKELRNKIGTLVTLLIYTSRDQISPQKKGGQGKAD